MIEKLLSLFNFNNLTSLETEVKIKSASLLVEHMSDFTHSSWLEDLHNQSRVQDYSYNLYS